MAGWFAWFLALAWLLGPTAEERRATITDKEKVQGLWQAVLINKNGKPLTGEEVKRIKLTIKGDTYTWDEGSARFDTEVKLNPDMEPKALDLKCTTEDVTLHFLGIYLIDGDRFEICLNMRSTNLERPPDFSSERDRICYVFRRAQP
jgi:uncharacterized protein (TIGR03067 family)